MLFIKYKNKNQWWGFDKEKMTVFNYNGGYYEIKEDAMKLVEICEYKDWHELYLAKHFCPLEVDIQWGDVWISPDGKYYNGEAHEVRAEEILEIIYGEVNTLYAGDRLEAFGWIRATRSLMWDIRFDELTEKTLTKKQQDALWDWCNYYGKKFPKDIGK